MSNLLKAARIIRGASTQELATYLGISETEYLELESQVVRPTPYHIQLLAAHYGLPTYYFDPVLPPLYPNPQTAGRNEATGTIPYSNGRSRNASQRTATVFDSPIAPAGRIKGFSSLPAGTHRALIGLRAAVPFAIPQAACPQLSGFLDEKVIYPPGT